MYELIRGFEFNFEGGNDDVIPALCVNKPNNLIKSNHFSPYFVPSGSFFRLKFYSLYHEVSTLRISK